MNLTDQQILDNDNRLEQLKRERERERYLRNCEQRYQNFNKRYRDYHYGYIILIFIMCIAIFIKTNHLVFNSILFEIQVMSIMIAGICTLFIFLDFVFYSTNW